EARADIVLLKRTSSSSLNDRIISFPSSSPPVIQTSPVHYLLECAGRIINRTMPTANNAHWTTRTAAGIEKPGSKVPSVNGYSLKNCPFQIFKASGNGRAMHPKGTTIHT